MVNFFAISEPLGIVICCKISWLHLQFAGSTWHQSRDGAVLLASRRYNGSRSRKTKGSLADTLQCNIWRRAQTPHRMTHCLHGGDNHGKHNGFTALGKTRAHALAQAASCTISTRGPCAGPLTMPRSPWLAKVLRLHLVYIYTVSKFTFGLHDYKTKFTFGLHDVMCKLSANLQFLERVNFV